MIEILTTGLLNSVQDPGRLGLLHLGVSRCGAMDPVALRVGNHMVGNAPDCAGIEIAAFPARFRFHKETAFAVTGAICDASLDGVPLQPWWSMLASAGQTLAINAPKRGSRAYVCFAGGIDVPVVLGSRSTDMKAVFGGFGGRGLSRGARIDLGPGELFPAHLNGGFGVWSRAFLDDGSDNGTVTLRVLRAAEFNEFETSSIDRFYGTEWTISQETNRIGCRLLGEPLALKNKIELFSHGITPGVVQVPPAGLPIVQMADANTCGGYPKIGNIIGPDIRKLAQAPSGTKLRFRETTVDDALTVIAADEVEIANILADVSKRFGLPTDASLQT